MGKLGSCSTPQARTRNVAKPPGIFKRKGWPGYTARPQLSAVKPFDTQYFVGWILGCCCCCSFCCGGGGGILGVAPAAVFQAMGVVFTSILRGSGMVVCSN